MTPNNKQTQKLRLRYISFVNKCKDVNLCQLGRKSTDEEILVAHRAILRLIHQKIRNINACIHHEKMGKRT